MLCEKICSKIYMEGLLGAQNYARNQEYSREHDLKPCEGVYPGGGKEVGREEKGRSRWINGWMGS